MAFNFKNDDASIANNVKIDGKTGAAYHSIFDGKERIWEPLDEFNALVDFERTQTGYVRFGPDSVDIRVGPVTELLPDSPGPEHKEIVQVPVYLQKYGYHILSITAKGVRGSLGKVYDQWTVAPQRAEGLLPHIKMTRVAMNKTAKGTQAVPDFEIVGWKKRPGEPTNLDAVPKPNTPTPSATEMGQPPSTGSMPNRSRMTPAPTDETEDEFG